MASTAKQRAAAKTPDPAVEPETPVEAEEAPIEVAQPTEDQWVKAEHIAHAEAMYGKPTWLVAAVLNGIDKESLAKSEVQMLVDAFENHQVNGG